MHERSADVRGPRALRSRRGGRGRDPPAAAQPAWSVATK
jgi:hypothetical protein